MPERVPEHRHPPGGLAVLGTTVHGHPRSLDPGREGIDGYTDTKSIAVAG